MDDVFVPPMLKHPVLVRSLAVVTTMQSISAEWNPQLEDPGHWFGMLDHSLYAAEFLVRHPFNGWLCLLSCQCQSGQP